MAVAAVPGAGLSYCDGNARETRRIFVEANPASSF